MNNYLSPWMTNIEDGAIEMSSRIRLARNIKDVPFPHILQDLSRIEELEDTIGGVLIDYKNISIPQSAMEDKALLVEKHLVSPLFTKRGYSSFINEDESVSIMLNEEDHLRVQVMGSGIPMGDLYEKAAMIDDMLEEEIDYAYDEQYGFLTACPTNVGTGMRASVMLHLPALSINKKINRFQSNLNRFGFALRGIYGEGSMPLGHIYQLSNQLTLGQTEEEIVENLEELKYRIMEEEQDMRQNLLDYHLLQTKDTVNRSFGILKHAYTLTLKEAAMHLSNIKLGVDLDLIKQDGFKFQEWIQLIQPAFIKMRLNDLNKEYISLESAVEEERATLMRERLGGN
jgi:protein arginine kinase